MDICLPLGAFLVQDTITAFTASHSIATLQCYSGVAFPADIGDGCCCHFGQDCGGSRVGELGGLLLRGHGGGWSEETVEIVGMLMDIWASSDWNEERAVDIFPG